MKGAVLLPKGSGSGTVEQKIGSFYRVKNKGPGRGKTEDEQGSKYRA